MAYYTPQQIEQIKQRCNSIKIDIVIDAFRSGQLTWADVPSLSQDRVAAVKDAIENNPDPREIEDWEEILSLRQTAGQEAMLAMKLERYCSKYASAPMNHIADARAILTRIKEDLERGAWEAVDKFSYDELVNYIRSNPGSPFRGSAEDSIWALCQGDINEMRKYCVDFPSGKYAGEAQRIFAQYDRWESIRYSDDILAVNSYSREQTPFQTQAKILLASMKSELLARYSNSPMDVNTYQIKAFIDSGVFTKRELIDRGLTTEELFNKMMSNAEGLRPPVFHETGTIKTSADTTDVYLFGIPSSGKTCVLTGLLGSNLWLPDMAAYGSSNYIEYLIMSRKLGKAPAATTGDNISIMKMEISSSAAKKEVVHTLNLIDMSGEAFRDKIVQNRDAKVSFNDMGIGATELLKNDNPKIIFFVIDSAQDGMIRTTIKDESGESMLDESGRALYRYTSQDLVLNKMISMLMAPENASLLGKIDSIHFIMAKADMLGNLMERDAKALEICRKYYMQSINKLTSQCRKHGINVAYNGVPQLYTFSLGKFYLGNVFEYDPSDSDKLVKVLRDNSRAVKSDGWKEKIKSFFNEGLW